MSGDILNSRGTERRVKKVSMELIEDFQQFTDHAINMLRSAEYEILILYGTKRIISALDKIGIPALSNSMAEKGVRLKILIPDDALLQGFNQALSIDEIRILDPSLQNEILFIIVDSKKLLLWKEKRDDRTASVSPKITSLYCDSVSVVPFYLQIFDSIWHHVEMDNELKKSRNDLARMAEELEVLYQSLAESNKDLLTANERLAANDQMQRDFINVAAHELRTPIQPILGLAYIMEGQFESGTDRIEVTKEDIDMLIRNAKRLERLSSEILEVARIESSSLKLNKELLKINEIIQSVIQDISNKIGNSANLRFEYDMSKDIFVYADKERINEVLYNLLDNAFKFTKDGIISISAEVVNTEVRIQVSDTGTGIDPQIFSKLFTKFATKSEKGTGLGLYITKSIVQAHGGRIWAENNNDKGATFYFTLPLLR